MVASHATATDHTEAHFLHVNNLSEIQLSLRLIAENGTGENAARDSGSDANHDGSSPQTC